jgi:hypothetical protein
MCRSQGATVKADVPETRAPARRTPGVPSTATASMPSRETLGATATKSSGPANKPALPPASSAAKKAVPASNQKATSSETAFCTPSDASLIDASRLAETIPVFLKDWATKVNAFAGSHYKEQRRPADNMNLVTLQKALGITGASACNLNDLADGAKKNQCIMRCAQELKKQLPADAIKTFRKDKEALPVLFSQVTW